MLERYKQENLEVKMNSTDSLDEKNRKRDEAIRDQQADKVIVPKQDFIQHVRERIDLTNKDEAIEKLQQIDFSNANPRNNSFMNELAFAGQSITEGFLDVFNIEVNKATEKYKAQNLIIEQKDENGKTKAFIGQFKDNRLKRVSQYFKSIQDIDNRIDRKVIEDDKRRDQELVQQKREQAQAQSLKRNIED
ncbi:hypothetical protein [Carnobacterium sp. 1290_CSPC]|uniref:hypothetical protein n=1 Tax=Carnobacterium sp. 1290_CSPC TaxID=1579347 RepID=UPI000660603F|nr:hypothetical protein [Carnobacterium sp. 1290_CSPC]